MGANIAKRSSFLTESLLMLPYIQGSMHFSSTVTFNRCLFVTQQSVPYNKTGIITVR